ncbi:MAG: SpoIIE family protein phosphatase [Victivallales bacterium]|nr:SpoIIE family protein phosphatase [Victivallales bacterium]MCF7889157.1 SpoIIE family protein phosphatase [Victivallales bacterium]
MKKRIRLNTLFAICLIVIIGISFLILFWVSVNNIEDAKVFSKNSETQKTKLLLETVFTRDIIEEAVSINEDLQDTVDQGKEFISFLKILNNYKTSESGVNFEYDKSSGLYSCFNPEKNKIVNDKKYGKLKYGYWGIYDSGKSKKMPANVIRKTRDFAKLQSLMFQMCSSNQLVGIYLYYYSGLLLSYGIAPETNYLYFNNNELFNIKTKKYYNIKFVNNEPIFKLVRGYKVFNQTIILICFPVRDSDGSQYGTFFLLVPYKILISYLNELLPPEISSNYKTVRLILDSEGNIAYLPFKYYKLLSLPVKKEALTLKDPGKSGLIETKLNISGNPEVRKMGKKLLESHSGSFELSLRGEKYICIFVQLPVNNWEIALLVRKADLYSSLAETEKTYSLIFGRIYKNYFLSFIIILISGFVISFIIFKKLFIKPIEHLREEAAKLGKGEFETRVSESGLREISDLSKTFNNLCGQLKTYTENLKIEISSRQAVETELKIAGDLQQSVLPKITTDFKRDEFELYSNLIPAKEMSGDFYDFFYINNHKTLVLVLADVSGKGLIAAFYMSMAKAIIKENCLRAEEIDPGKILTRVNNILFRSDDSCMFLTGYLIFYDIATGAFTYSNAGHHDFICIDSNKNVTSAGTLNNTALGLFEEVNYQTVRESLKPGQALTLFTDGIIEAPDENNNEYGIDRLKKFYAENYQNDLKLFGDLIFKDVLEYQEGNKFDDITLLILKRLK